MTKAEADRIIQFQKVRAIFNPRDTNNLRDSTRSYIGRSGLWEAMWVIEHECPYKGQWAFLLREDDHGIPAELNEYFGWVPECDLALT